MADEKILIVEDEAIVAMEIEARLRTLGYRIAGIISTGEAAIAAVHETMPSLVLMDIMLAGAIDGVRAADEVRRRFNIPVVFLTAYADEQTLGRAKLSEPFGYLLKPFEESELRSTIEVALYKHSIEKKLRESELRYRMLFERAGDAIFMLDAEEGQRGRIVDTNQAAAEMHGYAVDELRGKNITDIDAPDASGEAPALMDLMLKGEWIKKELAHRRKDDTTFPVEISAGLLEVDGHPYIMAIDRDITKRRQAEEAVQAALAKAEDERNKTEAVIAAMGDGISIQDREFKILYQNQVHKDIIGDHVGEYCYNAYEHKDQMCEGCGLEMSFKDGKIHTVERSAMTDRGRIHVEITTSPVRDSSGRIVAGIEMARNITGRKQAEEALLRMNRALRTLSKCNEALVRAKSEQDLLRESCQAIVTEGAYRMAWVGYAEQDDAKTVRPVAWCGFNDNYLETVNISWGNTEFGLGPTGTAIRTEGPSVVRDMRTEPRFEVWRDEAVKRGYAS